MAHPNTVVSWDAFSANVGGTVTPADSYDVVVVDQPNDANAGAVVQAQLNVTNTQVDLGDLMAQGGLGVGNYSVQVRAHVGPDVTLYSAPSLFSYVATIPGTPQNVTLT